MSNCCSTSYRIYGERQSLEKIHNTIKELAHLDKPRLENGWGNLWMGCIVDALGGNNDDVYCRGQIIDYVLFDDYLLLCAESAWTEMADFRHFLEDIFPNLKVYHLSEELGCAGIWTNDMGKDIFEEEYYIDSCVSEIDSDYFCSLEEVAYYVNDCVEGANVKPDVVSVRKFFDEYSEEHDDECLNLYEIERIDD